MNATLRVCAGCGELFMGRYRAIWCSERCRKAQYPSDPCVECGGPTSSNAANGHELEPRCNDCRLAEQATARELVDQMVLELRGEGLLNYQIADALGLPSAQSVASRVYRMRLEGVAVPRTVYRPAAGREVYA